MSGNLDRPVLRFAFEFDPKYTAALALIGVTPGRAYVEVGGDVLRARFGPAGVRTPLANVRSAQVTGPYRAYRAIGIRLSLSDRGVTFGSTTAGGVCIAFAEPVRGVDPRHWLRHPGLTVTVADREGLVRAISAAAGH
jgi:hypothetical protein